MTVGAGGPIIDTSISRPAVAGKFLSVDGASFSARGVTYGTFAPGADGERYPAPALVESDLSAIAAFGANAIRVYTAPPPWLLDVAVDCGLKVLVGVAWEQHVAFLESRRGARQIVDSVRSQVASIAGHPGLLCLAVGNEIPSQIVRWHGPSRVEEFIEQLCEKARAEDPGALMTYVNYPSTEYLDLPSIDLVSFNVFLESGARFESYVARLHNIAGDRPLLITEIGLDARANGQAAQARLVEQQVSAALVGGCAGAFVFSWTDDWHRGDEAVTDWKFGVTDEARRPKPAVWSLRKVFGSPPPVLDHQAPRVSVIVCSRNGARTLGECLEGIRQLDYPDVETIVVDDGSTDATAAIAAEFDARVVSIVHSGLGTARNVGLRAATGEIAAYIDDDAVPERAWLRFAVSMLLESEHVGVGGPNIPPVRPGFVASAVAKGPGGPTHVLLSDRHAEHIPGCNMVFWKAALDAVGGFDPRFDVAGDDVDICWQLQDRGWTLGFAPSAMVWHRRRNSLRAYLRQQRQYGRAEALLERKWPAKYNRGGHLSWAGRVYGGASGHGSRNRRRIRYGPWGENLFQSQYDEGPGMPGLLPLIPEWYLALALFGVLGAYELARGPVLFAIPHLPVPAGCILLALSVAALAFQSLRAGWWATRDRRAARGRIFLAGLTALLFALQPVARLSGRLRHGLTPWRRRGLVRFAIPWPRQRVVWSESWRSSRERLLELETLVAPDCMVVSRGGEYDRRDFDVRQGAFASARARLTIEEHGRGEQLVRWRVWPHCGVVTPLAMGLLAGTAGAAASNGAQLAAAVVAACALFVGLRALQDCGSAMSVLLRAVEGVHQGAPDADVALTLSGLGWSGVIPLDQVRIASRLLEGVEVDA